MSLKHLQHPDLFLQHPYETTETLETSIRNMGGEVRAGRFLVSGWEPIASEHHQHWARLWVPLAQAGTT